MPRRDQLEESVILSDLYSLKKWWLGTIYLLMGRSPKRKTEATAEGKGKCQHEVSEKLEEDGD